MILSHHVDLGLVCQSILLPARISIIVVASKGIYHACMFLSDPEYLLIQACVLGLQRRELLPCFIWLPSQRCVLGLQCLLCCSFFLLQIFDLGFFGLQYLLCCSFFLLQIFDLSFFGLQFLRCCSFYLLQIFDLGILGFQSCISFIELVLYIRVVTIY